MGWCVEGNENNVGWEWCERLSMANVGRGLMSVDDCTYGTTMSKDVLSWGPFTHVNPGNY